MKTPTLLVLALGLLLSGHLDLSAQPVITRQPASLAVPLGDNATFRVTATGTQPLTYQWRSEEGDISGATNTSLVVSNVSLADLGSYTVVVRNASGQTASEPAWLKLARWTELVVFGASECMAQYSNGPSWVEYLAGLLGLTTNAIRNYAAPGTGGTADVRQQISQYLSAHSPGTNTLLAPFLGGVGISLGLGQPVQQVVSNYAANISVLAQAGGHAFLVSTIVKLYLNPALSGNAYLRSIDYPDLNARLDQEIQKLEGQFGLAVFRFDFYDLAERVWASPTVYGFTNLTGSANACVNCDRNAYFWWDGLHCTTAAYRLVAQEMYHCLTPPVAITPPTWPANGILELRWQGGSPPFRIQQCGDLGSALWQSAELTFQTNATWVPSGQHQFFRVLNLGQ